jgi:hypothetical protein
MKKYYDIIDMAEQVMHHPGAQSAVIGEMEQLHISPVKDRQGLDGWIHDVSEMILEVTGQSLEEWSPSYPVLQLYRDGCTKEQAVQKILDHASLSEACFSFSQWKMKVDQIFKEEEGMGIQEAIDNHLLSHSQLYQTYQDEKRPSMATVFLREHFHTIVPSQHQNIGVDIHDLQELFSSLEEDEDEGEAISQEEVSLSDSPVVLEEPTIPSTAYSDVIALAMQNLTPKVAAESDMAKSMPKSNSGMPTVSDPFAMALGEVKQAVQSIPTSQPSFPSPPILHVPDSTTVDGGDA